MLFPWYIKYPNQNDEILNLDWILSTIDNLVNEVANFVTLNTIKYADPIQWNITTQYEKNTVVIDPITGSAYISTKPVPAGVGLNNEDYWNIIFTLDVISANKNITLRDDANNMLATFESAVDDWLLWQGTLYIVTRNIDIGQSYVEGYNINRATVEYFIKLYINNLKAYVDDLVGSLSSLTTTDKDSIVDAINEVYTSLSNVKNSIGTLQNLNTVDKDSIVEAINEVIGYCGTLAELNTTDKTSLVNAVNEVLVDVGDEAIARTNGDNALSNKIGDLNQLETPVKTTVVSAINSLTERKYILIADSYGDANSQEFPELFNTLSGDNTTYAVASGQSFQNGGLLTALQGISVDNPLAITDVLIQGGINDCVILNKTNTMQGVKDIVDYCASNYPNAKVSIAFVGRYLSGASNADRRPVANIQFVISALKEACRKNKCTYILNSEFILWNSLLIGADGLHPNSDGCKEIAYQLYNAMISGYKCTVSAFDNPSGTWVAHTTGDTITLGAEAASGALFNLFVSDNLSEFRTTLMNLNIATPVNLILDDSFYKFIGDINNSPITMSDAETTNEYKLFETEANIVFKNTSNNYFNVPMAVGFLGKHMYIRGSAVSGNSWLTLSNIDRIIIPATAFTINTLFI